jgi:hypothetical protein
VAVLILPKERYVPNQLQAIEQTLSLLAAAPPRIAALPPV